MAAHSVLNDVNSGPLETQHTAAFAHHYLQREDYEVMRECTMKIP